MSIKFKSNEEGKCPICNSENLEYFGMEFNVMGNVYYPWTCSDCGTEGKEWYYVNFDDISDNDGTIGTKEGICPICGADVQYGSVEPDGNYLVYDYFCPDCTGFGKEWYDLDFDSHTIDGHEGENIELVTENKTIKSESVYTDINKAKQRLINKAKIKNGIWENFGQDEVRRLEDKYFDDKYEHNGVWEAIRNFDNWCMNFSLSDLKTEARNSKNDEINAKIRSTLYGSTKYVKDLEDLGFVMDKYGPDGKVSSMHYKDNDEYLYRGKLNSFSKNMDYYNYLTKERPITWNEKVNNMGDAVNNMSSKKDLNNNGYKAYSIGPAKVGKAIPKRFKTNKSSVVVTEPYGSETIKKYKKQEAIKDEDIWVKVEKKTAVIKEGAEPIAKGLRRLKEDVDEEKTKVIFRKDKKDGDIIAVFADDKQNNNMIGCYVHLGQHTTMSIDYYNETVPATPEEYSDLKKELEDIGYNVEVVTELDENKKVKTESKLEESDVDLYNKIKNEPRTEKYKKGLKLRDEIVDAWKNKDLETAHCKWEELFNLFSTGYDNEGNATEEWTKEQATRDMIELYQITDTIEDKCVYDVTDYGKQKYYREEYYDNKIISEIKEVINDMTDIDISKVTDKMIEDIKDIIIEDNIDIDTPEFDERVVSVVTNMLEQNLNESMVDMIVYDMPRYTVYEYASYEQDIALGYEPFRYTIYDNDLDDYYYDEFGESPQFDSKREAQKYIDENRLNKKTDPKKRFFELNLIYIPQIEKIKIDGVVPNYHEDTNTIVFYNEDTGEDVDTIIYRNQTPEEIKEYMTRREGLNLTDNNLKESASHYGKEQAYRAMGYYNGKLN